MAGHTEETLPEEALFQQAAQLESRADQYEKR